MPAPTSRHRRRRRVCLGGGMSEFVIVSTIDNVHKHAMSCHVMSSHLMVRRLMS